MNKQHRKITKKSVRDVEQARGALDKFYEKTKQYDSTRLMLDNCHQALKALSAFYAARPGMVLEKSDERMFPHTAKTWRRVWSDSRQIWLFAYNHFSKSEIAEMKEKHALVESVFTQAIARADWLEEKDEAENE